MRLISENSDADADSAGSELPDTAGAAIGPSGGRATSMMENAVAYAKAGYRIFPVHNPIGDRCSCRRTDCKIGKHPRISDWPNKATTDLGWIKPWWTTWPDANIGLPTGSINRITVIDIDPRHGGNETWAELLQHRTKPITTTVRTGSGGSHIYFTYIAGLRSSANTLGSGIDVRSDGGYVLGVGSLHACGERYAVECGAGFAAAPDWLIELMTHRRGAKIAGGRRGKRKPASHWRRLLEEIHDGEGREAALVSLAGSLWRDGVSDDQLLSLLRQFNERHCRPPKPDSDLQRIANSIKGYAR